MSTDDAVEFMLAGASAIQVGTGNFLNPLATVEIIQGISSYLEQRNIKHICKIIGGINGNEPNNHPDI